MDTDQPETLSRSGPPWNTREAPVDGRHAHHERVRDEPEWFPDEVMVPDVVGMLVDDARKVAQTVGIVLAQSDADGPPLSALTWRLPVIVTSQSPPAGTLIRRYHSVVVTWGSELGGVREPRRPVPRSMSDFTERDPSEDATEA